ncbi:hypothetical protein, partial [Pseudidiomarina indica]|uniref:hypothetical protein n=1 Tax=Pseudidiomarina indica TaxID=1159017 RepID=UPI001F3C4558
VKVHWVFSFLVWLPFSLAKLAKLGRRLNEYQTASPDKFPLSPFVQKYAQKPPSKICSVSRALEEGRQLRAINYEGYIPQPALKSYPRP